jgi:hypothetical protein
MSEQWTTRLQQRTRALYRYMHAMERGDANTISAMLYEAERDQVLERMIMETNEVYQIEDRTVAHADDIEIVQLMLADMIPAPLPITQTATHQQQPKLSLPVTNTTTHTTPVRDTKIQQNGVFIRKHRQVPGRTSIKKVVTSRYSWLVAAAATLLILMMLPATSALANQFLALFRIQQLQPVSIDSQESAQALFTTLQSIGNLQTQKRSMNSNHKDLTQSEAEKIVGHHVLLPSHFPDGVSNMQHIIVIDGNQATYTFNMAKAKAYLAKHNESSVAIPAQLDGASYTITTASSVIVRYTSCTQGKEHCQQDTPFFISEFSSPSIKSNGQASITQLRDFLLSLPNLSPSTHEILNHLNERTGTIPVPVPPEASSETVTIHGTSGLLLKSNNMSAVIWEAQDILYTVALGTSDKTQILDTVNSLN